MTNGNGTNGHSPQNGIENSENNKLKKVLKKAINSENAPESLRLRISKMIREK